MENRQLFLKIELSNVVLTEMHAYLDNSDRSILNTHENLGEYPNVILEVYITEKPLLRNTYIDKNVKVSGIKLNFRKEANDKSKPSNISCSRQACHLASIIDNEYVEHKKSAIITYFDGYDTNIVVTDLLLNSFYYVKIIDSYNEIQFQHNGFIFVSSLNYKFEYIVKDKNNNVIYTL